MELLFGSSEDITTCKEAVGFDYRYLAWEGRNGAWHEKLEIFGKPALCSDKGFKRVRGIPIVATLHDRDVQIWNYLRIRPSPTFASVMVQFLLFFVFLVIALVLSQVVAYSVVEFGYMSLVWYIRYPLFAIVSSLLVFFSFVAHEKSADEYKLRKAARCIRGLSTTTNHQMESYKEVLQKISICNDKERAEVATRLLSRGFV